MSESTELANPTANSELALPAHIASTAMPAAQLAQLEKAKANSGPSPELRIVQAQTQDQLAAEHGPGAIYSRRGRELFREALAASECDNTPPGQPGHRGPWTEFQLIACFRSFAAQHDYDDPTPNKPFWLEHTLDENHEVAQKSMSRDSRVEPYKIDGKGREYEMKYHTIYNFVVMVDDPNSPANGAICVIPMYSGSAETGEVIFDRLARPVGGVVPAIHARRIALRTMCRQNKRNEKYYYWEASFDASRMSSGKGPWTAAADIERMAAIANGFSERNLEQIVREAAAADDPTPEPEQRVNAKVKGKGNAEPEPDPDAIN